MYVVGGRAWSLSSGGFDGRLVHALGLREALGLAQEAADVPGPLTLPPPDLSAASSSAASVLSQQWLAWWRVLVAGNRAARDAHAQRPPNPISLHADFLEEPRFESLSGSAQLRAVAAATWAELRDWRREVAERDGPRRARRGLDDARGLVARVDAALTRPMADVRVRLELLPIAGTSQWEVHAHPASHSAYALVSIDYFTDPKAHYSWLEDLLFDIG